MKSLIIFAALLLSLCANAFAGYVVAPFSVNATNGTTLFVVNASTQVGYVEISAGAFSTNSSTNPYWNSTTFGVAQSWLMWDPTLSGAYATFAWWTPHNWDKTVPLTWQPAWLSDNGTSAAGDVEWGLAALAQRDGSSLNATLSGSYFANSTDTCQDKATVHLGPAVSITVQGSPQPGDRVLLVLARDVGAGAGTRAGIDAVRLWYGVNATANKAPKPTQ